MTEPSDSSSSESGRRPSSLLRAVRLLAVLGLSLVLYLGIDLFFAFDLPLAAEFLWWAFQGVMLPKLLVDSGHPMALGLPIAILIAAGLAWRRPAVQVYIDPILAALVITPVGIVLALAFLMERPAALGAVVLSLSLWRGRGVWPLPVPALSERPVRLSVLFPVLLGLVCVLTSGRYLHLLLMTEPGYPLLTALGRWTQAGHLPLGSLYLGGLALVLALLLGRARVVCGDLFVLADRLGLPLFFGLFSAFVGRQALGDGASPVVLALVLVVFGLFAVSIGPALLRQPGGAYPVLRRTLSVLVLPSFLAGLFLVQAYSTRMLHCPPIDPNGPLERLAVLPEAFRVELGKDGAFALMSLRQTAELARIPLHPRLGSPQRIAPGPAAAHQEGEGGPASEFLGPPEELLYDPKGDRFLAALVTPEDFDGEALGLQESASCEEERDFGSVLVELDSSGWTVRRAFGLRGLCWLSRLGWDPVGQQAVLGWEYRPGLNVLPGGPETTSYWQLPEEVGDLSGIAVDPRSEKDQLFGVSLWESPRLSRLRRSDREVTGSVLLGGFNYDVVLDVAREHAFVPAYYASRVHVVGMESMRKEASLRTGLGTRAVALLADLEVLIASSVYDGVLRAWDLNNLGPIADLHVGGHVKDLAVDLERGHALFWSQCGLMRLDLRSWLGRSEGSEDDR